MSAEVAIVSISERLLREQLDYNLRFGWFVGLSADGPVWDVTVFTKNRERLVGGEVAQQFLAAVDVSRSNSSPTTVVRSAPSECCTLRRLLSAQPDIDLPLDVAPLLGRS